MPGVNLQGSNLGDVAQALSLTPASASAPPATASSPGAPGQIAYDASHLYVCVAANTWVRATLATF